MSKDISVDAEINKIRIKEVASPSTPASGYGYIYAKTTGLYFKGDNGVEIGPMSAGGGMQFAIYENVSIPVDSVASSASLEPMTLAAEVVDSSGLFTLADSTLTCVVSGWYDVEADIAALDGSTFGDGTIYAWIDSDTTSGPSNLPATTLEIKSNATSTDLQWVLSGPVALDVGDTLWVSLENNTANTISVGIVTLRLIRLGSI